MSELLTATRVLVAAIQAGEWDDLHMLATRVEELLPEGDDMPGGEA